jgi:hypothetical protein
MVRSQHPGHHPGNVRASKGPQWTWWSESTIFVDLAEEQRVAAVGIVDGEASLESGP